MIPQATGKPAWLSDYLYIRITGFHLVNESEDLQNLNKNIEEVEITFKLSNKICKTAFRLENKKKYKFGEIDETTSESVSSQCHLFTYEEQQVLNVSAKGFSYRLAMKQKQSKEQSAKKKLQQQSFSRVPITPFVALPFTCHRVSVNLIKTNEQKKVFGYPIAVLNLEVYYLLKFQAELHIYPFEGHFQRTTPFFGEMNLCFVATIQQQKQKSMIEQQGGIHPKWHEYSVKQDNKLNKLIKSKIQFKISEKNLLKFKLNHVGHTLCIDVINYPIFDRDAEIVGSAKLKLQCEDFFRICNRQIENIDDRKKKIKLHYIDPTKGKLEAGVVTIGYKFIFDQEGIRKLILDQSEDDD